MDEEGPCKTIRYFFCARDLCVCMCDRERERERELCMYVCIMIVEFTIGYSQWTKKGHARRMQGCQALFDFLCQKFV